MARTTYVDRFLSRVDKSGECWQWTASLNNKGYGKMWYEGRLWLAHRLSYLFAYGHIPNDKIVMHKCDNPACVRPDHLMLGTHDDNAKDMAKKGRAWNGGGLSGAKNGRAILSAADVILIRKRYVDGENMRQISESYKISQSQLSEIITGKSWLDITRGIAVKRKGENRQYKLNMEKANEIRIVYGEGNTISDISRQYGLHHTTVSRVIKNLTWRGGDNE